MYPFKKSMENMVRFGSGAVNVLEEAAPRSWDKRIHVSRVGTSFIQDCYYVRITPRKFFERTTLAFPGYDAEPVKGRKFHNQLLS